MSLTIEQLNNALNARTTEELATSRETLNKIDENSFNELGVTTQTLYEAVFDDEDNGSEKVLNILFTHEKTQLSNSQKFNLLLRVIHTMGAGSGALGNAENPHLQLQKANTIIAQVADFDCSGRGWQATSILKGAARYNLDITPLLDNESFVTEAKSDPETANAAIILGLFNSINSHEKDIASLETKEDITAEEFEKLIKIVTTSELDTEFTRRIEEAFDIKVQDLLARYSNDPVIVAEAERAEEAGETPSVDERNTNLRGNLTEENGQEIKNQTKTFEENEQKETTLDEEEEEENKSLEDEETEGKEGSWFNSLFGSNSNNDNAKQEQNPDITPESSNKIDISEHIFDLTQREEHDIYRSVLNGLEVSEKPAKEEITEFFQELGERFHSRGVIDEGLASETTKEKKAADTFIVNLLAKAMNKDLDLFLKEAKDISVKAKSGGQDYCIRFNKNNLGQVELVTSPDDENLNIRVTSAPFEIEEGSCRNKPITLNHETLVTFVQSVSGYCNAYVAEGENALGDKEFNEYEINACKIPGEVAEELTFTS